VSDFSAADGWSGSSACVVDDGVAGGAAGAVLDELVALASAAPPTARAPSASRARTSFRMRFIVVLLLDRVSGADRTDRR
jgi:hypothetical protein